MAIRLDKLRKEYADTVAVRDLSVEIPDRAVFGLIGPNGAGKSTTIRMIAGLLEPTSGSIKVDEYDVSKDPLDAFAKMGYLPDFFSLYENLKVWEYLDFFANAYKLDKASIPARIDALLAIVNLETKKDSFISTLSRGMKQRLAIAKTIIHDPSVILLDEPAAGLDPLARKELIELLLRLNRAGKTIIISSHILSELSEMCTHVGILEKGVLVKCGDLKTISEESAFSKKIEIEMLGDPKAIAGALKKAKGIRLVTVEQNMVRFEMGGDDKSVVALHKALIRAGYDMISFTHRRKDISDIFMEVSTNEVS